MIYSHTKKFEILKFFFNKLFSLVDFFILRNWGKLLDNSVNIFPLNPLKS